MINPAIAKVSGAAFSVVCQLVASCDLAYSTKDAIFATPGVNIGLFCSTPMVAVSRKISRKPIRRPSRRLSRGLSKRLSKRFQKYQNSLPISGFRNVFKVFLQLTYTYTAKRSFVLPQLADLF